MTTDSLSELSVRAFLERLASGDPTPGGGSASALVGALGASLVSMVCNLTVGRERYADFEDDARSIQATAAELRDRLQRGIDEDTAAYGAVIAAYRLPRGTDQEKAERTDTIQAATVQAALVPLGLVEASAQVIVLAERALGRTNPNAASDLAVGALLGLAAMDGAAANVEVNLGSIRDEAQKASIAARLASARAGRREQAESIMRRTHG
jgi:formiminotetrahydrofolate cyclodeaminase